MANWTNEQILHFLECYQGEPCIWNPTHINHKDKKKVGDAWDRLSKLSKASVKQLKTKKEALMATFRKHLKRKKDLIRSGAGSDDIYEPIWFAYQLMESFLLPIYTSKDTLNTETQSMIESEEKENIVEENINIQLPGPSSSFINLADSIEKKNSRRRSKSDSIDEKLASAITQITNMVNRRTPQLDECDLYGNLLVSRLREIPQEQRRIYMKKIDMIFYGDSSEYYQQLPLPLTTTRRPPVDTNFQTRKLIHPIPVSNEVLFKLMENGKIMSQSDYN